MNFVMVSLLLLSWALIFFAGGLATINNYNDFWIVLFVSGLLFGICAVKIYDQEENK